MNIRPHRFTMIVATALLVSACSSSSTTPSTITIVDAPLPDCDASAPATEGWDTPVMPHRIFGNTWYVGTCGISALLATSPQGHILIDAGTEKAAPAVLANIRLAGFEPEDIKLIVGSHEHNDHAGGMAALQHASAATVLAREPAATALSKGNVDRRDPQLLEHAAFAPVAKVQVIEDGHVAEVGPLRLTAHATPGHTPGGSSWTWRSCEGERCLNFAYVDSVSAISDDVFRFSDEAAHPGYLAAFETSLQKIEQLPCEVLVTPHPAASALWQRIGPAASQPLVDNNACRIYANNGHKGLQSRLEKEGKAKR